VDGQYPGSKLLDPQGALAQEVPSWATSAANTEVFFTFLFFYFVNQLFISVDNTYTEQRTIGKDKLTLGLKVPTVY